jgi:hypothetical protein
MKLYRRVLLVGSAEGTLGLCRYLPSYEKAGRYPEGFTGDEIVAALPLLGLPEFWKEDTNIIEGDASTQQRQSSAVTPPPLFRGTLMVRCNFSTKCFATK